MEPTLAINEGIESPNDSNALSQHDCVCGKTWNVKMERGEKGQPGCVRCSCGLELISWSGTITFTASEMPTA